MDKKKIKKSNDWKFKVNTETLDENHEKVLKQERLERYAEMKKIGKKTVRLEKKKVPERTLRAIDREHFEALLDKEDDSMVMASIPARFIAFFIDCCFFVGLNFAVNFEILTTHVKHYLKIDLTSIDPEMSIFVKDIAIFVFFILLPTMLWGQTLGKKIAGIRIKRLNGNNIGFLQAFLRETIVKLVLFFGVTTIPFNKKRRALHDYVSGTVVIKNKNHAY